MDLSNESKLSSKAYSVDIIKTTDTHKTEISSNLAKLNKAKLNEMNLKMQCKLSVNSNAL